MISYCHFSSNMGAGDVILTKGVVITMEEFMKRTVIAILMVAILLSSAFAYSNEQKIYSVDSGVYDAMETLYILAGQSLPSSSGPWSEAELQTMLARIDKASLSDAAQKYYDYVAAMITSEPKLQYDDNLGMEFGLDLALEGYYHTNQEFDDYNDWFHSYTDRAKFLDFTFETWPTEHFYGYFELSLSNCIGYDVSKGGKGATANLLYANGLNTNLPVVNALLFSKPSNGNILADFDWTFPYRAFVSAGGEHWNFMVGRDKLSWGNGETGNLMLSDSFPKHTLARFNTFFNSFKYSLLGTIYPSQASEESQYDSLDGYKAMIVHSLEFNFFKNKVGLAVNEACMYWSDPTDDQTFSLLQVNPFGFMHNEYIARNGNSLLVFEANYTPISGVNVYGQFAVDEFSGPGEGRVNTQALGLLAGVKGAMAAGDGIVTGSFEFVKTDPFLYIRGLHYEEDQGDKYAVGYGYDAYFRTISCDRIILERMCTTYKYGNDVILFDGKVGYEMPGTFKVGFEAMLMKHGSMDINSKWHMYRSQYEDAPDVSTPTTFNPFDSADYNTSTDTVVQEHAVEQSIILSLTGEYKIVKGLSASAKADFLIVQNMDNVEGNNQTDVQITVGLKYEI